MKLYGCGNPGFSYTDNFLNNITSFYEWVQNNKTKNLTYQELQKAIESSNLSMDESRIRMIVPFMVKTGLVYALPKRNLPLDLNNFFTKEGACFLSFLMVYMKIKETGNGILITKASSMFKYFGLLQFYNLYLSEERIYKELIHFLLKYKHIDKVEFFILTTTLKDENIDLDSLINKYRNGQIRESDCEFVDNINCFTYISSMLTYLGVLKKTSKTYSLNEEFIKFYREILIEEAK